MARKTIAQELAELQDSHLSLVSAHDALTKEHAAVVAERDDLSQRSAALAKTIQEMGDKLAQNDVSMTSLTAERDSLVAELDAIRAQLALTAIPTIAGAEPVPDGAEAAPQPMSYEHAHAEYVKITDPVKRAEYRAAHAKELGLKK